MRNEGEITDLYTNHGPKIEGGVRLHSRAPVYHRSLSVSAGIK